MLVKKIPGSRIRVKEFQYFLPKVVLKALESRKYDPGCSSRPPGLDFLSIPDPGSRGKKRYSFFHLYFFLQFLIIETLDPDPNYLKCEIRIRIWIRIQWKRFWSCSV